MKHLIFIFLIILVLGSAMAAKKSSSVYREDPKNDFEYRCPVHGVVYEGNDDQLSIYGYNYMISVGTETARRCEYCYFDMLRFFCKPLEKVYPNRKK